MDTSRSLPFQMPKRLILKAEIEEYLSSERADFLPSPKFSLSSTILDLYNFSSLPTDTFITLSDGQVSTYSDMLKSKCTHFRAVFSGDFCEGTRSVSANVAPTHLDDGSLDESLDQDPEPVADYDSDFDNRASSSQSSVSDNHKRDYKVVNLPNFSWVPRLSPVVLPLRLTFDVTSGKPLLVLLCCI